METNCKDCNRLIDECTCLADTVDFPKYTRDQKRRAVQEVVKRLSEFEATLRLIRQFDICEQDVLECTAARYDPRYTMSPVWAVRNSSIFDQAVEEATELRARAMQAAMSRRVQGLVTTPHLCTK